MHSLAWGMGTQHDAHVLARRNYYVQIFIDGKFPRAPKPTSRSPMKLYEFKFFDGQVFRGYGSDARDALVRLGLGVYNPVAYTAREIEQE